MPQAPTRRLLPSVVLTACAIAAGQAVAVPGLPVDDPELAACADKMMPRQSLSQVLEMKVAQGGAEPTTTGAELFWKRDAQGLSRVVLRLTSPRDKAGLAVLTMEQKTGDPTFMVYLPETRKARRVAGKTIDGSMFGTDFSYEDFAYFQHTAVAGKVKRLENQTVDGTEMVVLEAAPESASPRYSKVVSWLDKGRCTLSRMEFYAKNGSLLKELSVPAAEVVQVEGRWVPQRIVLDDKKRGSRTELKVVSTKIDQPLSDAMFNPITFGNGP